MNLNAVDKGLLNYINKSCAIQMSGSILARSSFTPRA